MSSSSLSLVPRSRATATATVVAFVALTVGATSAPRSPLLVSRFGPSSDVANSIARAVNTVGYVPWWALLIIGGGVAGILVRMAVRYTVAD